MKTKARSVSCRLAIAAAWITGALCGAHVALGQEAKPNVEEKNQSQATANKRLLAEMRTLADTFKVTVGADKKTTEAKLIPEPLLRFSDPARVYFDGTVWAWATVGRPVMMSEIHTRDRNQRYWSHDVVATSEARISVEIADHGDWAPQETGFKLLPVPEIRPPVATEAARLRQMKQFARRLSASELWEGQRYELQLLPTEIYRYSDAESGLVDGAAFVFAFGNNPEAILFVEAHQADAGDMSWKYGLARMSAAAVTFRLGDTEVWSVPQTFGSSIAPYYTYTRRLPGAVRRVKE